MNIPTYPFKSKFADSSPTRVSQLINEITEDVNHTNQGQGKPFSLKNFHRYSALLPCLKQVNEAFKHSYNITVLDTDVKNDLQQSKVINWCRTSKVLYPIKTRGSYCTVVHLLDFACSFIFVVHVYKVHVTNIYFLDDFRINCHRCIF